MAAARGATPFPLLLVLTLGAGLGAGLGVSEAPTITQTMGPALPGQLHTVFTPFPSTATGTTPNSATQLGNQLEHPYGLATAPDGTLYILDTGRDQVLKRLPSGTFQVVAGTGRLGFSGDGGPATDADLDLTWQSGIVVASSGALYFSDTGNGRVREVEPDGTITAVAGGGPITLGTASVAALQASFGAQGPAGLTMGPDGDLYIGAIAVYRLTESGLLQWVVGSLPGTPPPPWWHGVYSNPGAQTDFSPAVRLAFDGQGDLLVAGGGGFGLYEDTASGHLVFLENFRGDGAWGALASSPGGEVVLSSRGGLSVFQLTGTITPIAVDLDPLLGPRSPSMFIGGDGIAVGSNGEIYVDTNTGNTFTMVSALIEVGSDGSSPTVLWKS